MFGIKSVDSVLIRLTAIVEELDEVAAQQTLQATRQNDIINKAQTKRQEADDEISRARRVRNNIKTLIS